MSLRDTTMQQTTVSVNTGIAPLTNVALCLGTLKRAITRPRHHGLLRPFGFRQEYGSGLRGHPVPGLLRAGPQLVDAQGGA